MSNYSPVEEDAVEGLNQTVSLSVLIAEDKLILAE